MKNKTSKIGLKEFIWFGFNYTAGIMFVAVLGSLVMSSKNEGQYVGGHLIWIFVLEGIVAGLCAWVFARMSKVHRSGYGSAYIYARSGFGRFAGFFIGMLQYSVLPVIIISHIVSLIKINFTDPNSFLYVLNSWGPYAYLYLDLIGISIYLCASCAIFLGMSRFKWLTNISSYIKWFTTLIILGFALYLFIVKNGPSNLADSFDSEKNDQINLTAGTFSSAFTTCFFYFLGFEFYSTIGKNLKNPNRDLPLTLIIVMFFVTIFYVGAIILFIGAMFYEISPGAGIEFGDNPTISIFSRLDNKALEIFGAVLILVCTMSLKMNVSMQNSLYAGALLEPLALEGYIPENLAQLKRVNKYDDPLPVRAAMFNNLVVFLFCVVWLIIPDLIYGIMINSRHGHITDSGIFVDQNGQTISQPFSYAAIIETVSLVLIILHIVVISATLKAVLTNKLTYKKPFVKWLEVVIFICLGFFLIFLFIEFFIKLGDQFNPKYSNNGENPTYFVNPTIQLVYIALIFIVIFVIYFAYYKPKLKKRLVDNPALQLKKDNFFTILTNDQLFEIEKLEQENILNEKNSKKIENKEID